MRDAFDDLERDLRRAVRARRARRVRRTLIVAVAGVLALAGAAASQISRAPDVEREVGVKPPQAEVERVLIEAVNDTINRPECRIADEVAPVEVAERPLVAQVTDVLPALAKPAPGTDPQPYVEMLQRSSTTGTIASQSLRTLEFPGGHRLTVFVLDGGYTPEQDPEACAEARRKRAAELAKGELLKAVERRIAGVSRPRPGQQFLYMSIVGPGEPGPHTSGFNVMPKLRTGIVERGNIDADTRRYEGIVSGPRVAWVRIRPTRGPTRDVRVRDGFYVFTLRRGSGRARATELTLDGKEIRTFRVPR